MNILSIICGGLYVVGEFDAGTKEATTQVLEASSVPTSQIVAFMKANEPKAKRPNLADLLD